MPELPEVECIRRSLQSLTRRQARRLVFSSLAPIKNTTPARLRREFEDSCFVSLQRRGKYLLLTNDRGATLVVHLGMSGTLQLHPSPQSQPDTHRHLQIFFDDGSQLVYRDPRRFGTLSLSLEPDGDDNRFLARLGPDYLDPRLKSEAFVARCRKHPRLSLKALALHQGIAAGLGNIYACESLYHARLDPRRFSQDSPDKALHRLFASVLTVLHQGIARGGSSLKDYFDGRGQQGSMQNFLQVYGREGLWSLDGKGKVRRIVQQGRSTWFCPDVQV